MQICSLLLLQAIFCSLLMSTKLSVQGQLPDIHFKLGKPILEASTQSSFVTVAIIGTNDIHGTAFPTKLFRSDNNETYNYGGLEYMASMIKIIKQEHQGNVIYLDAGDQFQGGIQSSPLISNGTIMNDFYNALHLDASAIGNHEFDFGQQVLFPFMNEKADDSINLAANLKSQTGQSQFLPKHKNSKLFQLKSGIKIGVIGLSTIETPSTTSGFTNKLFPLYKFQQYTNIVIAESKQLRDNGANAVLIVSHVGNTCTSSTTYGIWDADSIQDKNCNEGDEMGVLLKSLPKGTVDGVLQGHRHTFSHYFINQIPIMGAISGGYYFNVLYLKFYDNKIYQSLIEGPIPVCEKIFANYGTCNYLFKEQLQMAGRLTNWEFHKSVVTSDEEVRKIFETKWLPLMEPFLVPLVPNEVFLARVQDRQSELANLITNLIHTASSANDFVIINHGGFRTIWVPGMLLYQHFYNMLPFVNTLISFEINGYQLMEMLAIVQGGKKGIYPTYGIQQKISVPASGNKSLISAKFSNGENIIPTKTYRGVSTSFLLDGGDDFKDVMNVVYAIRKEYKEGQMRSLLKQELIKWGPILENTLIDPTNPRIIIVAK